MHGRPVYGGDGGEPGDVRALFHHGEGGEPIEGRLEPALLVLVQLHGSVRATVSLIDGANPELLPALGLHLGRPVFGLAHHGDRPRGREAALSRRALPCHGALPTSRGCCTSHVRNGVRFFATRAGGPAAA